MPVMARAKRKLAPLMGSRAVEAEAKQTLLCALLSGALLVGLSANAALGWWWADPLAGLFIASLAAYETVNRCGGPTLSKTPAAAEFRPVVASTPAGSIGRPRRSGGIGRRASLRG